MYINYLSVVNDMVCKEGVKNYNLVLLRIRSKKTKLLKMVKDLIQYVYNNTIDDNFPIDFNIDNLSVDYPNLIGLSTYLDNLKIKPNVADIKFSTSMGNLSKTYDTIQTKKLIYTQTLLEDTNKGTYYLSDYDKSKLDITNIIPNIPNSIINEMYNEAANEIFNNYIVDEDNIEINNMIKLIVEINNYLKSMKLSEDIVLIKTYYTILRSNIDKCPLAKYFYINYRDITSTLPLKSDGKLSIKDISKIVSIEESVQLSLDILNEKYYGKYDIDGITLLENGIIQNIESQLLDNPTINLKDEYKEILLNNYV